MSSLGMNDVSRGLALSDPTADRRRSCLYVYPPYVAALQLRNSLSDAAALASDKTKKAETLYRRVT